MAAGHGEKRSRKADAAVAALLDCATIADAAARAGVGERTLRRWLHDDSDFRAQYQDAGQRCYEGALAKLRALAERAVQTLGAGLDGKATPAQIRAAEAVLAHAAKAKGAALLWPI